MKLENGIIVDTPHWTWCIYETEEIANKVHRAILFTNPNVTISDVSFLIYSGLDAYGFRVHK